ncbi:F-box and associated interaction domains-containing protein putative isoform 1 [Tripterygium wilfordii]|uniref:F-box and associated interaction domains-containing protein putative isoform 1 n=1 Tax=Tripterygium wilfordii TaxID=458696 RepID=A0A7J7DXY3_TRIWF|nr:F-box/kelch-repeat protein At3g06240-like [Tripterygium wilfordii]KAF5751232.1 F-box and associated interaction domains-containing protein putative isoform 1 [Tripterygium wilfordii]
MFGALIKRNTNLFQKKIPATEAMKFIDIPEDLVTNILLYLPAKSLARFKCVCKSWCSLIGDPKFVVEHHHKQTTLYSNSFWVIGRDKCSNYEFILCFIKDDGDEIPIVTETISHGDEPFCGFKLVLGPRNGLYCVCEDVTVTIINPSTGESKTLPDSQLEPPNVASFQCPDFGFGFDNKNNDYKVLRFVDYDCNGGATIHQIELYSLKSESWRKLAGIDNVRLWSNKDDAYKDGVYYWWAKGENGCCILSFDMVDEVFETMPLPDFGIPSIDYHTTSDSCNHRAALSIFKGSLAAIAYPNKKGIEGYIDIWVMAALKETWVKQARIGPISAIGRPLVFWKNGGLFLEDIDGQLAIAFYDPRRGSIYLVEKLPFHPFMFSLQVLNYSQSLVSINGEKL